MKTRSRIGMRKLFVVTVLGILLCKAHAQDPHPVPLRVLSTCRAAHDISLAKASRGYPVRLRGVVTFYDANLDPRHAALFVHDHTGSIFMALPSRPVLPLKPGTVVVVEGVTGTGDYAPVVLNARVKIVGRATLPKTAARPTMVELLSGNLDGQWVEIEGIVRGIRIQFRNVTFEVGTAEGGIFASAPLEPGIDYNRLIDSEVRMRGNAVPVFNASKQMVGARLLVPSIRQVTVVKAAGSDPFNLPIVPVSQLLQFSPGVVLRHRKRIRGVATLFWPGRLVCIQEASRGLCIDSDSREMIRVGDTVDAVGFPGIKDLKPTLQNASFRIVGRSAFPAATWTTVETALAGGHDQELVQMQGELIGQDRTSRDLTLGLRWGQYLYFAVLPNASLDSVSARWKEGSTLRVTGICELLLNSRTSGDGSGAVQPQSVRVLLRTTDDVALLREPSWWTRGRVLALLGLIALLGLAALGWGVTLRHKVEQQTKAIRQSEERLRHLSEHDVLTGLPNRFLLNDRMEMALRQSSRTDRVVGILMIDLDRFKEINDNLGHTVGDQVLRETAARLIRSVRATDTVARVGGDEFVVVLPDLKNESEAEAVAAKIVEALRDPIQVENTRVAVSASVGVGSSALECRDPEKLLHMADTAMYRAKRNGRDRYHLSCRAKELPLEDLV
jgi:diguanylate cyclase (GGDEF)-like protein